MSFGAVVLNHFEAQVGNGAGQRCLLFSNPLTLLKAAYVSG